MRSWFDILTAVSHIKMGPGLDLQRWINQVQKCLKLLAVQPFSGFESLGTLTSIDTSGPVFFDISECG